LLFANFLLKSAGHKVIYLGSKVPVDSVRDVIDRVEVQHLLVFMIRTETATSVASYLEELSAAFKAQEIHVAGSSRILAEVEMKGNVKWMRSIDDLEEIIKELEHVN
jgi:methanogenic corrinoid protein MtbC1